MAALQLSDLPEPTLRHILLAATDHADLVRHVSVCARVCSSWRHAVSGSASYGRGWPAGAGGQEEALRGPRRGRVLRRISVGLRNAHLPSELRGVLDLNHWPTGPTPLGDEGGRVLGAALRAMAAPLALAYIGLGFNRLTPVGLAPVLAELRRPFAGDGLEELIMSGNAGLGDAGVAALAAVLPATLEKLDLENVGCGNAGMAAIAARLPVLAQLEDLDLRKNPLVSSESAWQALGAALPQLPALAKLSVSSCEGMGDTGIAALAVGLPGAAALTQLSLYSCNIGDAGARVLMSVLPSCDALVEVSLQDNAYRSETRAALVELGSSTPTLTIHPNLR
eukprot:COSAG02_NODE_8048_length_2733_cov_2.066819_1_plen_337_part_00